MNEEVEDNEDGTLGFLLLGGLIVWVWGAIVGAALMWVLKS